mmetsp:Transcript_47639/g.132169  ORF Transcript_47639/g.132169 Transcript_47639/m.132169 type:complete len:122 (-) Transcript_47639:59-424(-)
MGRGPTTRMGRPPNTKPQKEWLGVYDEAETEADALALENDVLRRKLVRMELKLEDLEAQRPPGSGREHLGEAVDIDALVAEGYREEDEVLGATEALAAAAGVAERGYWTATKCKSLSGSQI